MKILIIGLIFSLPILLWAKGKPLILGEEAVYSVSWERIATGAEAGFSFKTDSTGRFYLARFYGRTNSFGSLVYKSINKEGWSLMDAYNLAPLTFNLSGKVADIFSNESWHFQQSKKVNYYYRPAKRTFEYLLADTAYDILSGMVFFRLKSLDSWLNHPGSDTLRIPIAKESEVVDVLIIYQGESSVKLAGKNCSTHNFLVMLNDLGRQMFAADANLLIFFSTADHHLPLRMETNLTYLGVHIGRIIATIDLDRSSLPYSFP